MKFLLEGISTYHMYTINAQYLKHHKSQVFNNGQSVFIKDRCLKNSCLTSINLNLFTSSAILVYTV